MRALRYAASRSRLRATSLLLTGSLAAFGALAVAGPATAGHATGDGSSAANGARVVVPGAAAFVSRAGTPLAATAMVRISLAIGRDGGGLRTTAMAVSTPANPAYGRFLSPAQVQARFGARAGEQARVARWLVAAGLRITHRTPFLVTGLGSAAAAQRALGTSIASVPIPGAAHTREGAGQTRLVTGSVPTAPRVLQPWLEGVNLTPRTPPRPPLPLPAQPATHAKQPCSTYFGQKLAKGDPEAYGRVAPYASCWYSPAETRAAYAVPASLTGKGITVATVGLGTWPAAVADMNRWAKDNGVQKLRHGQLKVKDLNAGTGVGELAEFAGDQEAVHGLAPDANLLYVDSNGQGTGDYYADDLAAIVQHKWADVVSSSTGDCISWDPILNTVLQRAAAEGITVSEASGDWGNPVDRAGAGNCYVRDTPYETIVGGTSLAIGKSGGYEWELPWAVDVTTISGDKQSWNPAPPGTSDYYFEGGGGVSDVKEPGYQRGIVTHNRVQGKPMRVGPDVAMEADCWIGGYPEGYQQTAGIWTVRQFCGTSMAAPLFSALIADVLQSRDGKPLGFLNPALYSLYGTSAFRQITTHSAGEKVGVVVPPSDPLGGAVDKLLTTGQCKSQNDSSLPLPLVTPRCGKGYNEVTGIGSPAPGFYQAMEGVS